MLAAAALRKPVLVDGFISTAAALVAQALSPASAEYMIAAHRSVEPGHRAMHQPLGKEPLLDLQLGLGEGTGAALAMPLVEAAKRVLPRWPRSTKPMSASRTHETATVLLTLRVRPNRPNLTLRVRPNRPNLTRSVRSTTTAR